MSHDCTMSHFEATCDKIESVNRFLGQHNDVSLPVYASFESSTDTVFEVAECSSSESLTSEEEESENGRDAFRDYAAAAQSIKEFYKEQHTKQTVAFNLAARDKYLGQGQCHARMTVWQAMEMLDTLVDESDPDTSLSQIQHLLQTAEAIRRDGKPDWMQLTGLLHDLGKLLVFFGANGQWDVVGDTFIVGCAFDDKTIYHDTFGDNPDTHDPRYNTKHGMYTPGCGLDNVLYSWGHDEYMYCKMKQYSTLPQAGLDMIRLHSCYPLHREGAYRHFFAPGDEEKVAQVQEFNKYDLYSKSDSPPDAAALRPYYEGLIDKYIIGGRHAVLEW